VVKDLRVRLHVDELRRLYFVEKMSLEEIARSYGVSRVAIWKYCKACGFIVRGRSEARLEAQKKGKVPHRLCRNVINVSLRGAKRRSNLSFRAQLIDCFAPSGLAMTVFLLLRHSLAGTFISARQRMQYHIQ
jgi:predicted DNA-binding protein YlxM (UPF0122 family)